MTTPPNQARPPSPHMLPTRLVHAVLALAVISQLATSQFMDADHGGGAIFEVHEYGGLAAFGLVLAFWLLTVVRRRGTPLARLIPWFSAAMLNDVRADLKVHLGAAMRLRLPPRDDDSPLASATHGLGLLLMTTMAASGTLYYFVNIGDPDAGGLAGLAMTVHTTLANLAWAYLIGHAAMALLAHYGGTFSLSGMWSFRRRES